MQLTQEIKDQWVTALRSGKYLQGQGFLRQKNKKGELTYCCLGVLGEITGTLNACGTNAVYLFYDNAYQTLTITQQNHLSSMNDYHKYNFNVIADYIEENIDV